MHWPKEDVCTSSVASVLLSFVVDVMSFLKRYFHNTLSYKGTVNELVTNHSCKASKNVTMQMYKFLPMFTLKLEIFEGQNLKFLWIFVYP